MADPEGAEEDLFADLYGSLPLSFSPAIDYVLYLTDS